MRKSRRPEPAAEADPSSSESGFSYGLLRVAVAQICQSMGFRGAQDSALEVITDIAARYLKTIAKAATTSANTRGRTQSSLPDIIVALEDIAGASRVGPQSLYASAAIKDLMSFVKYTDEIPFAQPLPKRGNFYEQGKLREQSDGRWQCDGENMRHVPSWLPALPLLAVPKEEKERRWEEGRWGCLNGGAGREEDDRAQPLPSRENFYEQGKLREQSDGRWQCDRENMRHVPSWLPALPLVAVPEEEKERRWEEGRWGCLNGGARREEGDRGQSAGKREGNKEIELLGKGKRLKVGFIVGIGNGRVI